MKKSKLAIIVPYRNRKKQLDRFIKHIDKFFSDKDTDYHIFVVEQSDNKSFNQGKLLNIGFASTIRKEYPSNRQNFDSELRTRTSYSLAKSFRRKWRDHKCSDWDFTHYAFHDVDLLPEKDVDYSYPEHHPIHLAGYTSEYDYQLQFADYFGGVTLFTRDQYELVNGRSNNYWGWGFEDDDLLYRCRKRGVPLSEQWTGSAKDRAPRYINTMEFNGKDFLYIKNSMSLNKVVNSSFSVETWVQPSDDLELDPNKEYDEFHIFTRPGYHVGICYTSGMQYKGGLWNSDKEQCMVVSDRHSNEWSHIIYTVDVILEC